MDQCISCDDFRRCAPGNACCDDCTHRWWPDPASPNHGVARDRLLSDLQEYGYPASPTEGQRDA